MYSMVEYARHGSEAPSRVEGWLMVGGSTAPSVGRNNGMTSGVTSGMTTGVAPLDEGILQIDIELKRYGQWYD